MENTPETQDLINKLLAKAAIKTKRKKGEILNLFLKGEIEGLIKPSSPVENGPKLIPEQEGTRKRISEAEALELRGYEFDNLIEAASPAMLKKAELKAKYENQKIVRRDDYKKESKRQFAHQEEQLKKLAIRMVKKFNQELNPKTSKPYSLTKFEREVKRELKDLIKLGYPGPVPFNFVISQALKPLKQAKLKMELEDIQNEIAALPPEQLTIFKAKAMEMFKNSEKEKEIA